MYVSIMGQYFHKLARWARVSSGVLTAPTYPINNSQLSIGQPDHATLPLLLVLY